MLIKTNRRRQFGLPTCQELSDTSEVGLSTELGRHQRIRRYFTRQASISEPAAISSDGSILGVIFRSDFRGTSYSAPPWRQRERSSSAAGSWMRGLTTQ